MDEEQVSLRQMVLVVLAEVVEEVRQVLQVQQERPTQDEVAVVAEQVVMVGVVVLEL